MVGSDNNGDTRPTTTVRPAGEIDAEAIARIYDQGIRQRHATFETTLRTPADMTRRIGVEKLISENQP